MPDLPYSPLYRAGDWCCVSGQIGLTEDGLVDGFDAQLRQVFANLDSLLRSNGLHARQVAKVTVFLADMDDYPRMNELYAAYFGDHRPARSAVAVAALPFGALVELEAWVYDPR
ncbi:MAG TPA: RidA family protein [Microthrixaceae bacterium]|nr:RidA family protein [Microthrixaceae bacterium]